MGKNKFSLSHSFVLLSTLKWWYHITMSHLIFLTYTLPSQTMKFKTKKSGPIDASLDYKEDFHKPCLAIVINNKLKKGCKFMFSHSIYVSAFSRFICSLLGMFQVDDTFPSPYIYVESIRNMSSCYITKLDKPC